VEGGGINDGYDEIRKKCEEFCEVHRKQCSANDSRTHYFVIGAIGMADVLAK
jgi:hypothetical protein